MVVYKAYLIQDGDGCDYTIGCGKIMIDLKSKSFGDAIDELTKIIRADYGGDEFKLKDAYLFEVNKMLKIPTDNIYLIQKKEEDEEEQERMKNHDIAEYERLKLKFANL